MHKKRSSGYRDIKFAYFSRHVSSGYMIKGEIWLEKNDIIYLDNKRITLLNLIDKYGSLAAAARSMKLSYNTAWLWVVAMNRLSTSPLVKRGHGGAKGGYSVLTAQGHKAIADYHKLNINLKKTVDKSQNLELNMK